MIAYRIRRTVGKRRRTVGKGRGTLPMTTSESSEPPYFYLSLFDEAGNLYDLPLPCNDRAPVPTAFSSSSSVPLVKRGHLYSKCDGTDFCHGKLSLHTLSSATPISLITHIHTSITIWDRSFIIHTASPMTISLPTRYEQSHLHCRPSARDIHHAA